MIVSSCGWFWMILRFITIACRSHNKFTWQAYDFFLAYSLQFLIYSKCSEKTNNLKL